VAEGTRLLSGRRSKAYRGFESLPLRKVARSESRGRRGALLLAQRGVDAGDGEFQVLFD
jgi:hypothetical protein